MNYAFDWKGLQGLAAKGAGAPQLVIAVNITLVILLAYSAAVLSWRVVPAIESEPAPIVQSGSLQQQVAVSGSWNIAQWSLFGKERQVTAPSVVQQEIPKTKLKLTLRGVYVTEQGGGAIIAEANGQEQFYPVNGKLSGGVTLKEVHETNVILMRNGTLETLELPNESMGIAQPTASSAHNTSARRGAGSNLNLKQYREDLLREPQRLTDAIRMNPKSERGRFIGYEVNPGRDRALFDRVGLMSGDIVTAVNGIQLDTPAKGLNVLRSLQTANSVRLDIKRNGRVQSFDVSID